MNLKNFFCAIFFASSFYKITSGYSFHKTFKSPKEKYDELVEEKDKLEILERSNFSIEEDENEEQKSKDSTVVDNCPRATATAQVHVRFGTEHGESRKNENEFHVPNNIQQQFYEKRSLMFDPFMYQQFLYYMFLNGGQFGHHPNYGHYCNQNRRIPDCQHFHHCQCLSNCNAAPNYAPSCDASYYYNPNAYFLNSNLKRDCESNSISKNKKQHWEKIQNVPVKQLTKQELKSILNYLDNGGNEETEKSTLEDSFSGSTAATPAIKRCQKRSIPENCKFPSYYINSGMKVTNNLELIAVNISSKIW